MIQPISDGHDMDHYADDLAALTENLDLKDAIHVGHSTGGGEVVHYIARHGESRVAKAAILSAVPPLMVKTGGQSRRLAEGRIRGLTGTARRRPQRILSRLGLRAVLWLQPARREALRRGDLELVAAGHNGWGQGPL